MGDDVPESERVFLPANNNEGVSEQWNHVQGEGLPIASLIGAMVETMQSWNDNVMLHAPGFRDRVVHIGHTDEEGGLNLEMPGDVIKGLSDRGATAGQRIVERFATGKGWDNHRWVRYRSALGMLHPLMSRETADQFMKGGPIDQLIETPPSYSMETAKERAAASLFNQAFVDLAKLSIRSFESKAPRPRMVLRPRPRDA